MDTHLLQLLLARAAEVQGATREQAIKLAADALARTWATVRSMETSLALFDEVEAAARELAAGATPR